MTFFGEGNLEKKFENLASAKTRDVIEVDLQARTYINDFVITLLGII